MEAAGGEEVVEGSRRLSLDELLASPSVDDEAAGGLNGADHGSGAWPGGDGAEGADPDADDGDGGVLVSAGGSGVGGEGGTGNARRTLDFDLAARRTSAQKVSSPTWYSELTTVLATRGGSRGGACASV